jgi:hypothetical protein
VAIEWSYDLLSEAKRVLLRRLSVFAGSFTLVAAEDVCTDETICSDELLTLLARLMDKSLLTVEPASQDTDLTTCYRFLDTIRSFGRLKLEEAGKTRWDTQPVCGVLSAPGRGCQARKLVERAPRYRARVDVRPASGLLCKPERGSRDWIKFTKSKTLV